MSQSTPPIPSLFMGYGETNLVYRGTLALCTAVSAVSLFVDTKLVLARAGGNRFAIEDAMADEQVVAEHCTVSRPGLKNGRRYYTLVTSLFNHASLAHLSGNMLGLYNVGRARMLKPVPFLIVFYGGGVLGNLLCLALDARTLITSGRRVKPAGVYFGASGGVAALMAFMSCCFPRALVTMYDPLPLTLPYWMHTVGYVCYCSWAQLTDSDQGIAHLGHLGGIVWGVAYFMVKFRRLPWV